MASSTKVAKQLICYVRNKNKFGRSKIFVNYIKLLIFKHRRGLDAQNSNNLGIRRDQEKTRQIQNGPYIQQGVLHWTSLSHIQQGVLQWTGLSHIQQGILQWTSLSHIQQGVLQWTGLSHTQQNVLQWTSLSLCIKLYVYHT